MSEIELYKYNGINIAFTILAINITPVSYFLPPMTSCTFTDYDTANPPAKPETCFNTRVFYGTSPDVLMSITQKCRGLYIQTESNQTLR